jgi:transcriptional regulator with XRE-family HTH domain
MPGPSRKPLQAAERRKTPIGPAIRLLRERKGMLQRELADRAGIMKGMASSYETGRQYPALETLVKILETLEVDFADLQVALDAVRGVEPKRRSTSPAEDLEVDRERRIGKAVLELASAFGIQAGDLGGDRST